jgi:protein-L-isoaspartate(D-aspartate) O-methyltransferase
MSAARDLSDSLAEHRRWFAQLITASAGVAVSDEQLRTAFELVPREHFLGSGPWSVFTRSGYIETPSDNPAFVYQDIVIALKRESQLNNGQPMLHAACIGALRPREGETVVHVGAGTGYYSAILSHLVGSSGRVVSYEIDGELAERAKRNLAAYKNVSLLNESGVEGPLQACDALYVNAGAPAPATSWLDALKPGGRLLFPLTPGLGAGYMLLIRRGTMSTWVAQFVSGAMFTPCVGSEDDETARRLAKAFAGGGMQSVRSLRRGTAPDETCWFAGRGWWLSAEPAQ